MTLPTWNEIQAGCFPREYVLWTKRNSSSIHNLKRTVESSFMFAWFGSCYTLVLRFTGYRHVFSLSRENLVIRATDVQVRRNITSTIELEIKLKYHGINTLESTQELLKFAWWKFAWNNLMILINIDTCHHLGIKRLRRLYDFTNVFSTLS